MLRQAAAGWRALRSGIAKEGSRAQRAFSDASASGKAPRSRLDALTEESETAHKLFDNARLPPEAVEGAAAGHPAAGSTAEAAAAAEAAALDAGPVGRIFSAIGNTLFFGGVAAASFFGYYTYRYDVDQVDRMISETESKPENAFPGSSMWVPLMRWYADQRRQLEGEMKKYADPPNDRLLPDLPPHARHIKTLVLDLDDVLVHSDWTRGRGWRTFKRPGVDDFIRTMSQYYELVLYTSQLPTYADPILDRLDPQRTIQYRLYRDSTQYKDGKHVRDLSKLNRDMRQVLFVTADPDAYSLQPENAIKLKKEWKEGDTMLLDLMPFLEAIVRTHVPDVRDVVKSYDGQDIPTAYRERMKRVQEQQAARQQQHKGFLGGMAKR
ncbi:hypothetical protein COHA_006385 [Chlorella ohadii]|uniref:Mitochondrial import inner membrane translocase subunit TIM50 n=1 Tax=Chlorella ohadii TaxID=2649997 RepID=A0AAD5DL94_9CHLO|nr:hypothetical protein COHA_006385 [Chlorella ohadii]